MWAFLVLLSITGTTFGQWFGGMNMGGPGGAIGYRANPAWASIAQPRGPGGPDIFSGGLDFLNQNGHGVSVGGNIMKSHGLEPSSKSWYAQGNAPIINTPNNKLDAWARHDETFTKFGKSEVNSGGLNYVNPPSGVNLFGTVAKPVGQSASTTLGVKVPITDHLSVSGSRTLTPGQKPNDQVLLQYGIDF